MFSDDITEVAAVAGEVGPLAASVGTSLGPMGATWWTAWARHVMQDENWRGDLRCIVIRDGQGRMRAFLPFATQKLRRFPLSTLAGSYFPFRCFIMDREPAVVSALARALRRRFWAFRLGPCPSNDPQLRALLREMIRNRRFVLERSAGTRFFMTEAQKVRATGWPKASLLKRTQYYERRLSKRGAVSFSTLEGGDRHRVDAFLKRAAEVERRSWVAAEQQGHLKIATPAAMRFWSDVFTDPGTAALCRVSLLTAGNEDLAFQLGVEFGGNKIIIANGYDESMAEFNPGTVAVWKDIGGAMERGVETIDYGVGDGGYKQRWGFEAGPGLVDVLVSAVSIPEFVTGRLPAFGGFRPVDPKTWI